METLSGDVKSRVHVRKQILRKSVQNLVRRVGFSIWRTIFSVLLSGLVLFWALSPSFWGRRVFLGFGLWGLWVGGSWLFLEVSMTVSVLGRPFADCAETTIVNFRIVKLATEFVSEVRAVNGVPNLAAPSSSHFVTLLALQLCSLSEYWELFGA